MTSTNEDREILWDIIANIRDSHPRHALDADSEEIADAILAAGFRIQGPVPEVQAREGGLR